MWYWSFGSVGVSNTSELDLGGGGKTNKDHVLEGAAKLDKRIALKYPVPCLEVPAATR